MKLGKKEIAEINEKISIMEKNKQRLIRFHRGRILKIIDNSLANLEKTMMVMEKKGKSTKELKEKYTQVVDLKKRVEGGENKLLVFYLTLIAVAKVLASVSAAVYSIIVGAGAFQAASKVGATLIVAGNTAKMVSAVKMPEPGQLNPISAATTSTGLAFSGKSADSVSSITDAGKAVKFFSNTADKIASNNLFRIVSASAAAFILSALLGTLCHRLILVESGKMSKEEASAGAKKLVGKGFASARNSIERSASKGES